MKSLGSLLTLKPSVLGFKANVCQLLRAKGRPLVAQCQCPFSPEPELSELCHLGTFALPEQVKSLSQGAHYTSSLGFLLPQLDIPQHFYHFPEDEPMSSLIL